MWAMIMVAKTHLHRGWFCAVPPSGQSIPPLQGHREQRRHWFWYPVRRFDVLRKIACILNAEMPAENDLCHGFGFQMEHLTPTFAKGSPCLHLNAVFFHPFLCNCKPIHHGFDTSKTLEAVRIKIGHANGPNAASGLGVSAWLVQQTKVQIIRHQLTQDSSTDALAAL